MLILGLSGGPELIHESCWGFPPTVYHDAACVLLEDGKVVCAIEEERLNRTKHTNKFPLQAIQFCLDRKGVSLEEIDHIAYYSSREALNGICRKHFLKNPESSTMFEATSLLRSILRKQFHCEVDSNKLCFVNHHYAHAMSTYALSGYDRSLIVTIDGEGDGSSGLVVVGNGMTLDQVADFPVHKSLGLFYLEAISYLGYQQFDEYKVMGLASYGNHNRHRKIMSRLYTLLPCGDYEIHWENIPALLELGPPRRKNEPPTQIHKDIAASLQVALEEITTHFIRHYQAETGERNICLAGGVAHNCTLNGKLLSSGIFENIFVQPASHDAGGALGSALYAYYMNSSDDQKPPALEHVYWGTDINDPRPLEDQLARWESFVTINQVEDISETTAELLMSGKVIGWVQGRSEFGPRALGNRSILADPRPGETKDRINRIVKKREDYRPFAPAVLEEDVRTFFEVPQNRTDFPFMNFVVKVRPDKRSLVQAITHVDGTARLQTVSWKSNDRFCKLLQSFKRMTGIPMLLNTSFNNHAEPIVDSVDDAVVCFLTTGLDYLVVGNYLVMKKDVSWLHYRSLTPSIPPDISLQRVKSVEYPETVQVIKKRHNRKFECLIAETTFEALMSADGKKNWGEILDNHGHWTEETCERVTQDLIELWSERMIAFSP
jgi:carbamoyltransferase